MASVAIVTGWLAAAAKALIVMNSFINILRDYNIQTSIYTPVNSLTGFDSSEY